MERRDAHHETIELVEGLDIELVPMINALTITIRSELLHTDGSPDIPTRTVGTFALIPETARKLHRMLGAALGSMTQVGIQEHAGPSSGRPTS
jgi:hypothetical protein